MYGLVGGVWIGCWCGCRGVYGWGVESVMFWRNTEVRQELVVCLGSV